MLEALEIFKQYHNITKGDNPKVFRKGSEQLVNDKIMGIPLYFLNYNAKKPFLKHQQLHNKGMYLCDYEEALLRHNFYKWLWQFKKKQAIYMCFDGDISINHKPSKSSVYIQVDKNFKGMLDIIDYDVLP